jgi:acyl carrier protein
LAPGTKAPGTKENEQMAQSREEVIETMKDVLASELGVEADKVTGDARFKEDLDADSLDLVEVVLALEEKFGIEISDDQIAGVKTVGEAADLVISKQTAVG